MTAPEWHSDPVAQAINEYHNAMAQAANYRLIANRHPDDTSMVSFMTKYADAAQGRAHDAVLEAAKAVKKERAS